MLIPVLIRHKRHGWEHKGLINDRTNRYCIGHAVLEYMQGIGPLPTQWSCSLTEFDSHNWTILRLTRIET